MGSEETEDLKSLVLTDGVRSETLRCNWRSWRVLGPRTLAVDLPAGQSPRMDGLIEVAETLMPGVRQIQTFVDGVQKTVQAREGRTWTALEVG